MTRSAQLAPVLLAGGGSAGHVSPLLAIADALRRRDPNVPILALGTDKGLEARLVPERGYDLAFVPVVKMPRKLGPELFGFPGKLRDAVAKAGEAIDQIGARVVVGVGGYVSTPAYLAARSRKLPIVIHEANSSAGMANKLGARLGGKVGIAFNTTKIPNSTYVGMPMRREITTLDRSELRGEARSFWGLDQNRKTLLVTGGSLGAVRINEAMSSARGALRDAGIQVLHITGKGKADGIESDLTDPAYRVVEYVDRMDYAYSAADMILCRSGANTVCEVAAVGLPAAFVPLAVGNGEQWKNAEPMVSAGGGMMVHDSEISGDWVAKNVVAALADDTRLTELSDRAAAFGVADADDRMADMVIEAMGR